MRLYQHQADALEKTKQYNRVAYYHDMGLGKTFTGAEKVSRLGARINLVVCQKSKIDDWVEHFKEYYSKYFVYDLTVEKQKKLFFEVGGSLFEPVVGVINYDVIFRRPELLELTEFTLLLDESSEIQNSTTKRAEFIAKLEPRNVILLSGTPVGGKYENLWSQLHLLGWGISEKMFINQYVEYHYEDDEGFPVRIIDGYKNVDRLKRKMRDHGCHFLKSEEVFDLPEQNFQTIYVPTTKEYWRFVDKSIIKLDAETELVGDTIFTKMLHERRLCGQYCESKLTAFRELLQSTNERVVVFYNYWGELGRLCEIVSEIEKPISVVNGEEKNLDNYRDHENSVTFIQYQAGAMGLNLQKANIIVYFTPPLSSELYEQSKKRIHRIGQSRPCFYYNLVCRSSIEEHIYEVLEMRKDYTEELFNDSRM